MAGDQTFQVGL